MAINNYRFFYNPQTVTYPSNLSSFPCWGYDNTMYFDHSYSATKAYVSLGVPSVVFIVGVVMCLTITSNTYRKEVIGAFAVPFVIIAGLVMFLVEVLGLDQCSKRSCCDRSSTMSSDLVSPSQPTYPDPTEYSVAAPPCSFGQDKDASVPRYDPVSIPAGGTENMPPPPSYDAAVGDTSYSL